WSSDVCSSDLEIPDVLSFPGFKQIYDQDASPTFMVPKSFHDLVKQINAELPLFDHYTQLSNLFIERYKNNIPPNLIMLPNYYKNLQGWVDQAGVADGKGYQQQHVFDLMRSLINDLKFVLDKRPALL